MTEPPFRRIAVVGNGLIGASILLAARRAWPDVTAIALDAGDDLSGVAAADRSALTRGVSRNGRFAGPVGP